MPESQRRKYDGRTAPVPTDVSVLLTRLLQGPALGPNYDFFMLSTHFPAVIGERLVSRVKLVSLRAGELTLKVENAAWKSELSYQKKAIIERCNALLHKAAVTSVRFI